MKCPICNINEAKGMYCGNACRQKAFRIRQKAERVSIYEAAKVVNQVYQEGALTDEAGVGLINLIFQPKHRKIIFEFDRWIVVES